MKRFLAFLAMLLVSSGVLIGSGSATGVASTKLVCVYESMDLFMDKSLPGLISNQVAKHDVNVKIVRIVDQILHPDNKCDVIIKIDRAINQNYAYTDHTTKYLVDGNVITIFTYKTSAVFSKSSGGGSLGAASGKGSGGATFTPMTNWSCEISAHTNKYYSNYQISNNGYGISSGYCDPYSGTSHSSLTGLLPYNVIQNSVDSALKSLRL
jgi:hypothetical protein